MKENLLKNALKHRWGSLDLRSLAAGPAKKRMATLNEWAPPEGIKPRRDLLYLSVGIPDSEGLPRDELQKAMQQVMARRDDTPLRYGFGQGYFPIRDFLARRYTRKNRFDTTPDWFQMCNGSSGAIDLVVRSFIDPGDVVITESPVYMGSLGNFIGVGAEVSSVNVGPGGMDPAELRNTVLSLKKAGRRVKIVYTISTFQNPTGVTMSRNHMEALLRLASEEGFLILEDAAYEELYYDQVVADTLFSMSEGYGVISVGSFSKTVATGLRIGWMQARPECIRLMSRMRFDMGQNQMALQMMGRFLADGCLEPHLDKMRRLYKKKMEMCAESVQQKISDYIGFIRPRGGFYLWAELARGIRAEDVWRTAAEEGVAVNPGYSFFPDQGLTRGEFLRIAYSWTPMEALEEAVSRLACAVCRVADGDATTTTI
ncbi:MAG: PLP-dependent aminotransferase family protein [Desulfobacterales bacterium]